EERRRNKETPLAKPVDRSTVGRSDPEPFLGRDQSNDAARSRQSRPSKKSPTPRIPARRAVRASATRLPRGASAAARRARARADAPPQTRLAGEGWRTLGL